jgi:CheY-like chemotaxis protein
MSHVRLIHWKAEEAEQRAQQLRSAEYDVLSTPFDGEALRALRERPPSAVVIDLSRLPSHGRDVALSLRKYKSTRRVPLVFVGGAPQKVKSIRALLPDAVYTTWSRIPSHLADAIANPPVDPVVPRSVMDAYAGTPLPKKLGIKPGSLVSLINTPEGFVDTLGDLPEGVELHTGFHSIPGLTLWFTRSRGDLERHIDGMAPPAEKGGLWILWPKKSSGVTSDLSQSVVRELAIAAGLVDFKVCSVDETWSGLRSTQKKTPAP